MIKKLLFCILLIGCLAGTASALIEIPGGTVSSYNLNVAGETYKLMGNVEATGTAFSVGANSVTLDGNGHTITFGTSTSGYGVLGVSYDNITIKNVTITTQNTATSSHGVYIYDSENTVLNGIYSSSVNARGIYIYNDVNTTLINSHGISVSSYGINIKTSSVNNLDNCTGISTGLNGLYIDGCAATINNSIFISNTHYGGVLSSSTGSNITGSNISSNTDRGLYILNSANTTIRNTICNGNTSAGIYLSNSTNSTIFNLTASSISSYGIWLSTSSYNSISNSRGLSNSSHGVYLLSTSNNNTISDVVAISNYSRGFVITGPMTNTISNITVISSVDPTTTSQKHILMIGDSITDGGAGGVVPIGSYGINVNNTLNDISSGWVISNKGLSGERADQGRVRFIQELDIYNPQYVTILYGANDISASRDQQDIINDILWMATTATERGIIPYIILTPAGLNNNSQRIFLDQNLSTQADALGIRVINAYDAIDTIPNNGQYNTYNSTNYIDSVHPNDMGNGYISANVFKGLYETSEFSCYNTSGTSPFSIKFVDKSPVSSYWYWDFENDGIIDSTKQNPVHTYGKPGTYSVNLTVHNEYGNFSTVKNDYITVTAQTPPSTIDEIWNILKHFFFGLSTQEAAS